ncbi:glycosyl hydrolase family 28 protein [Algoriphagus halophytocola]|uniref:Glycosyl hydrolase family 28 protein n=1 Tax=Algoriphagus halophytocola TaxID=2991499 RepID=A0ABY6MH29_9BACT|nr:MULTISPECIES: glycosyl hydrolase family 28 protein [unclassified Algoriphagus]UZD21611.1 glycosyl hydrolase family 28 protein [Algoriphagus sp. TR-M5]WBL42823.1 glycosyl hydrolase family 28 protein [Algoriphagus sp. TR-M9]
MLFHHLKILSLFLIGFFAVSFAQAQEIKQEFWPDGSPISPWFHDYTKVKLEDLGKQYLITAHGVIEDSTKLQTEKIQQIIDQASENGGGVIVIPKGTFLSGALFFKPKTHLHLSAGAVLKGSDEIENYPLIPSRMEGQNLDYFAALVNAYGVDGFTISGHGTINGNGLKFWEAFWQRRAEDPNCTNLEVSRPRLVFIWKSNDVQLQDVNLINAGFWSSHYYQCQNIKILDLTITSPHEPVKAPSTDAIDLDVVSNVLIKGCYLAVNDDAIALKGGKGPWADEDPNNGENTNILIEDSEFGFCHGALTNGSESIHNKNVIMRNIKVQDAVRLLWLKMRPDTPQHYEYITLENISGKVRSFIYVKPWTQFFDLKGKEEVPISTSEHITMRNMDVECEIFFDVAITEHDRLSDFTFENLIIQANNADFKPDFVEGFEVKNVEVNGKKLD